MGQFIKDIFLENSSVSSVRIMSVMCVIFAFIVAIYALSNGADPEKASWIIAAFLAPAFGGKVMQKKYEVLEAKEERQPPGGGT